MKQEVNYSEAMRMLLAVILTSIAFGASDVGAVEVPEISTDHVANFSNFLVIHHKGLKRNQTYDDLEVLRACECRRLCLANPNCTAFSVAPAAYDRLLCSLSDSDVYTNTPHSVPNATYYVRPDPQDLLGLDNLFYRRINKSVKNLDENKRVCDAIPGFRLIAVWAQVQMPLLLRLCLGKQPTSEKDCNGNGEWFYVDMIKVDGVPMIQGKIPLNETDLSAENDVLANDGDDKPFFIYAHSLQIHDDHFTTSMVVCQANLFGLPW